MRERRLARATAWRSLAAALAVVICLATGGRGAEADPGERPSAALATDFVEQLGVEGLRVVARPQVAPLEKRRALHALVERGFDLDLISRFTLGRFWRAATSEQRREYKELFVGRAVDAYARNLDVAGGGALTVIGSEPVGEHDVLVTTRLEKARGAATEAGWRVRATDDGLKIIDVFLEGVSLSLTQRGEFTSVIEREGIDGLLRLFRERQTLIPPRPSLYGATAARYLLLFNDAAVAAIARP